MVRNDEVESGGRKGKGKESLHAAPFYLNALKSLQGSQNLKPYSHGEKNTRLYRKSLLDRAKMRRLVGEVTACK